MGLKTCEIHTRRGHEKKKVGNWGEKPNQRRARQFMQITIAAKCFSIFSGYLMRGNSKFFISELLATRTLSDDLEIILAVLKASFFFLLQHHWGRAKPT